MRVHYICGYGRSGSTSLGSVLSERFHGVHVGEVSEVASSAFLARARCACGEDFAHCTYWRGVDQRLRSASTGPVRTGGASHPRSTIAAESILGLLVPMFLLEKLVGRLPFSSRYPGVSYREGVRLMAAGAHGVLVDGSKTTRNTANRPRLLRASGAAVDLYLVQRRVPDIVGSHIAAAVRRGRPASRLRSTAAVLLGKPLADFSARICALSLRVPLAVVPLAETVRAFDELAGEGWSRDHAIAGNRSRLSRSKGSAA